MVVGWSGGHRNGSSSSMNQWHSYCRLYGQSVVLYAYAELAAAGKQLERVHVPSSKQALMAEGYPSTQPKPTGQSSEDGCTYHELLHEKHGRLVVKAASRKGHDCIRVAWHGRGGCDSACIPP